MSTATQPRARRWYNPVAIMRSIFIRPRVFMGVVAGVAALFLLPQALRPAVRWALAWDIGASVYILLVLQLMIRQKTETLRARSARADEGGAVILTLIIVAILASFAAMAGLAGEAKDAPKGERLLYLGLAAATLLISWLVMQFVFTIHYAHRYYAYERSTGAKSQALHFPGDETPDYWDFLYFATSIGATSQTSDVSIHARELRRLVTLHAVVSFLFNTMVLAITINIAAGML